MYSVQPSFTPSFAPAPRQNRPQRQKQKPTVNNAAKIGMIASLATLPLLGAAAFKYGDSLRQAPNPETIGQKIGKGLKNISNFGTKLHGLNFALTLPLTAITVPLAIMATASGIRKDTQRTINRAFAEQMARR